jgi:hypothetical protein
MQPLKSASDSKRTGELDQALDEATAKSWTVVDMKSD